MRPLSDIDAHWHLAMGRAYLEHGLWLEADPISYLDRVREVDMGAWGGQVLFAWLHSLFGLTGVIGSVASVAALCHALVLRVTYQRCQHLAAAVLSTAIFAAASIHRWRGRPDVFSILFFILMMALLWGKKSKRSWLSYSLLTLIWINMHPGAIIMPAFALIAAHGSRERRFLTMAMGSCLALLFTPRGPIALAKLVYHTVTTGDLVPEWRPLWQLPGSQFQLEWMLLVVVLAVFVLQKPWRTSRSLSLLSLFMALRSFRLSYMFFVPTTPDGRFFASRRLDQSRFVLALILVLVLPLRNRWQAWQKSRDLGASPWTGIYEPAYPVHAADFIDSLGLKGRLFHPVAWGGYLGGRLAPRNQSAHDGRISEWGHKQAQELLDFGSPKARERLRRKLNFEIVVVSPGLLQGFELEAAGGRWRCIFADHLAAVYLDTLGEHWSTNRQLLGF